MVFQVMVMGREVEFCWICFLIIQSHLLQCWRVKLKHILILISWY